MNPARERVRTARALEGLPGINDAFQKGELSFSKVRAMTRIATEENESNLLDIASPVSERRHSAPCGSIG
jgi:hypothetical protein